jgi:hypothetical protein
MGRFILKAKTMIHRGFGKLIGWPLGRSSASNVARAFAEELTSNIQLPFDAKMIAVARGLQVAGIMLCVMDGKSLEHCECFSDLALTETKERVKQILVAAMSNWTNLSRYEPSGTMAV